MCVYIKTYIYIHTYIYIYKYTLLCIHILCTSGKDESGADVVSNPKFCISLSTRCIFQGQRLRNICTPRVSTWWWLRLHEQVHLHVYIYIHLFIYSHVCMYRSEIKEKSKLNIFLLKWCGTKKGGFKSLGFYINVLFILDPVFNTSCLCLFVCVASYACVICITNQHTRVKCVLYRIWMSSQAY